jgi:hypothetical protein
MSALPLAQLRGKEMTIPICILAFNRPHYLKTVLLSIKQSIEFTGVDCNINLFQDGSFSNYDDEHVCAEEITNENKRVFESIFPNGTIHGSSVNLGIAKNFDRAERFVFETLASPYAFFFEDDMVVDKFYLQAMQDLGRYAIEDERIGMFAAYGFSVRTPTDEQHKNSRLLAHMNHNWAFGLSRDFWKRRQPFVDEYLETVGEVDYRKKYLVTQKVEKLHSKLGFRSNVISQDMYKALVTAHLGAVRLTTFPNRARYIGERGLHTNPEVFKKGGYAETIMYPHEYQGFDTISDERFAEISDYQRKALGPRDEAKTYVSKLPPHMTKTEQEMFVSYLKNTYFLLEFGCGGSTALAGAIGVEKIASVDSDPAWLTKVSGTAELQGKTFIPFHVDIGPTGAWGTPSDTTQASKWPKYYTSVWSRLSETPDLIFVDGRFRVACILYSLLKCEANSIYVIHDFWNREHYHCVLEFLDCVDKADTLGVFKAKQTIDWRALAIALQAHALDPR